MGPRTPLTLDARSLLTCIPLFSGLKPDLLGRLATDSRLIELPGHRSLFGVGQAITAVHYLISGAIKRFTLRADKMESILELVQPGSFFALSESFVTDHYASFAETIEPSTILAISMETLRELVTKNPILASRFLHIVALQHHVTEFDPGRPRSLSVTQRVLDYLLSIAGNERDLAGETIVELTASKRLIAARLDMAPETFSRTLRQLSDDGIIVVNHRTVHIQNATVVSDKSAPHTSSVPTLHYPRHERGTERGKLAPVEVINLFGRNRMLSQRLTSAWIMLAHHPSRPGARVALRKLREELQRNLVRTNEVILPQALQLIRQELNNAWPIFFELLRGKALDTEEIHKAFRDSEQLLTLAENLTVGVVNTTRSSAAKLVNIAGRNRMQCARIAKLILFAGWGIKHEDVTRLVAQSVDEFEQNFKEILSNSSNSPEALAQLKIDAELWQNFLALVSSIHSSARYRSDAIRVFDVSEELLRHLDTTVKIHERLARKEAEIQAATAE